LYTNGLLALPTIRVPPGATVKLSGWDFSSTIRISAAEAACAKPINRTAQPANRSALKLNIVGSLVFLFLYQQKAKGSWNDPARSPAVYLLLNARELIA
jgi:hypothetical protein